jgi:hypothetical protein
VGCSSQGGSAGALCCVSGGEAGLLEVVVLLRRVVGTGCFLWSQLLPEAVVERGKGYAGSAWLQLNHPGKGVDQSEWQGFLCRSVYEPGLMSHLPENGWQAAGLGFNW